MAREIEITDRVRIEDLPPPVPAGIVLEKATRVPMLNLTKMDDVERRLTWECIKRRRPALAQLLREHGAELERIRAAFNGAIRITVEDRSR